MNARAGGELSRQALESITKPEVENGHRKLIGLVEELVENNNILREEKLNWIVRGEQNITDHKAEMSNLKVKLVFANSRQIYGIWRRKWDR